MTVGMMVAYDANGNIVATQSYQLLYDIKGHPVGLVDYQRAEESGIEATEYFHVRVFDQNNNEIPGVVKGAKFWPEYLGARAFDFKVELDGPPGQKRIAALVHKTSGHRRERCQIDAAIAARIVDAKGGAADIRDLVGGPDRPIKLDHEGRAVDPLRISMTTDLPVVAIRGNREAGLVTGR
jgi:hypothetical protein